jgi:hypothetical protein
MTWDGRVLQAVDPGRSFHHHRVQQSWPCTLCNGNFCSELLEARRPYNVGFSGNGSPIRLPICYCNRGKDLVLHKLTVQSSLRFPCTILIENVG